MPPSVTFRLIELCLFRCGPQDLPFRPPLALTCLLATVLLEVFTHLQLGEPSGLVVAAVLASAVFLLVSTRVVLRLAGRDARYWQTLLALTGSGLLFTAVLAPIRIGIGVIEPGMLTGAEPLPPGFTPLVILGLWRLVVLGHIWRHALEIRLRLGMLLAVSLAVLEVVVMALLFAPAVAPAGQAGV